MYIHNGILFSHTKEYPAIFDNMDEPQGHYAKGNKLGKDKLGKDKYHMISHVESKKNKTKQNKKKSELIETENG